MIERRPVVLAWLAAISLALSDVRFVLLSRVSSAPAVRSP
jgi:hypothetical protein